MRRYPLSFRHTVYNEGAFYLFNLLARKGVVPGERISSLTANVKFVSAVFEKANVTPMLVQAWSFYVPHRLVWGPWVDFVALDPTAVIPTSTTQAPVLYEQGSTNYNVFCRRGVKLVYNQYFGDETQVASGGWYADINADSDVTLRRLLAWDQWHAHMKSNAGYTPNTYVAPVSGASATITLDDFQRAVGANNAKRRQTISGDKYVDTMRLFGVELDWAIQMAPEFLGTTQAIVVPRERSSTQAVDGSGANQLFKRSSEWSGQLHHRLVTPKAFSEHGNILTFIGFRPAYMLVDRDKGSTFSTPSDFYRPEQDQVADNFGGALREKYAVFTRGVNIIGLNTNGNVFANSAGWYPPNTDYVPIAGSGPQQMGYGAEVQYKGLTPIRPVIA